MKKRLSIVGLGWFGMELAKALSEEYSVFGTKRSVPFQESEVEILPLSFNPEPSGTSLSDVFNADLLVLNIPPNSRKENAESDYRKMMDAVVSALQKSPIERAIFISSTGVFGDNEGEIDEKTLPIASTKGGHVLLEAEKRFLSIASCETCVLRSTGLVGGDRHPAKFLAGRKSISGRMNPVNLVHRDDLISMTAAMLKAVELKDRVFHACAEGHPSKEEYYSSMARKLGLEVPSFNLQDNSKGKEVNAEWSKEKLDLKFKYDDPFTMI